MRGRILVLLLVAALLCCFGDFVALAASSGGEPPLTLLQKPQTAGQAGQSQGMANTTEELRDIYGPVPTTEPLSYLLLAGVILGLLLVAAAIYHFLKKSRRPKPAPVIAPWERALLDLAEARSLLSPEQGLLYLERVSQILRRYIESRFAVQSTRQTTREFLQGLTRVGADSPLQTYRAELQGCLELADMAKFAHRLPDQGDLLQMEAAVTTFIQKTEPPAPEKPAGRGDRAKEGRP